MIGAVLSVQLGAAAATTLFDEIGPAGTVFYRLLFAAAILLVIWRPDPRGAERGDLVLAGVFGVSLAAMNFCFYAALDRIPLGPAVTFEFVGPLTVALAASRRALDLIWVPWPRRGSSCSPGRRAPTTPSGSPWRSRPGSSGAPTSCSAPASGRPSRAATAWPSRWRWPRR